MTRKKGKDMNTSKFQFSEPYLVELNFSMNPTFDGNNNEIEMQNSFQTQVNRSAEQNLANVELQLETNKENANAPFRITARIAADFIWEELDDEAIDAMLGLNAPALLLGYLRPIIANITNSSAFPAYNLPFINFKE